MVAFGARLDPTSFQALTLGSASLDCPAVFSLAEIDSVDLSRHCPSCSRNSPEEVPCPTGREGPATHFELVPVAGSGLNPLRLRWAVLGAPIQAPQNAPAGTGWVWLMTRVLHLLCTPLTYFSRWIFWFQHPQIKPRGIFGRSSQVPH